MSLLNQQNFLAKLYTDDNFREKFIAEPQRVGIKHKLNENEIAEIKEILPDEIIAFADSLFYKRLREVERFLPLTRTALVKDFQNLFREFIKTFNPQGVKKHLEDAVEFAKFLQNKGLDKTWVKDLAKLEQTKLEFGGFGRRFIVRTFDYDIRVLHQIGMQTQIDLKKRKTIAIWLKVGKLHKHFTF